jgi:dTDP-4-dehydrorhamnose reductase
MRSLIGYSGYVGSTLLRQQSFDHRYRSNNIATIVDIEHEIVVCAAAPAKKWVANRTPEADLENIKVLTNQLNKLDCKKFILISTVDVFNKPAGVDENSFVDEQDLHPYGLHRRHLEVFVEERFSEYLIVRLPGLVGPGLTKNVIFDFLNSNKLEAIDSRNMFQFYPMVNLWSDIQIALNTGLKLLHLAAEPISVADIAMECFGKNFSQSLGGEVISYDFQTRYAEKFGVAGRYQYNRRETLQAIRAYVQSEQPTLKQGNS